MTHISIRDLQKISGEAISKLPGLTAIKSGDRTIALLVPLRRPDVERLERLMERAEALAQERDPAKDEAFLAEINADPSDWSLKAVRTYVAERKASQ